MQKFEGRFRSAGWLSTIYTLGMDVNLRRSWLELATTSVGETIGESIGEVNVMDATVMEIWFTSNYSTQARGEDPWKGGRGVLINLYQTWHK